MRLIDADALSETLAIVARKMAKSDAQKALMGRVLYILDHRHEEVVRCKDCTYGKENLICTNPQCTKSFYGCQVPSDHYCSYGERRTE